MSLDLPPARGQILRVFLIQGGIVGFSGSVLGCAIAAGFLVIWHGIARNPDGTPLFPVEVDLGLLAGAALIATAVGIVSAMAPARRASRLDPVVAIRG